MHAGLRFPGNLQPDDRSVAKCSVERAGPIFPISGWDSHRNSAYASRLQPPIPPRDNDPAEM
jgi:hypothetical protein